MNRKTLLTLALSLTVGAACSDGIMAPDQGLLGPGSSSIGSSALISTDGGMVDLIAGQNMDVGYVMVSGPVGGELTITYVIDEPGWCLTETHFAVVDDFEDFQTEGYLNKKGNPKVGQFPYGDDDIACLTEWSETVPAPPAPDGEWMIAAHAVVESGGAGSGDFLLYGVKDGVNSDGLSDGDIYSFNPVTGVVTLLQSVTDPSTDVFSPNGLALHAASDRLYFSVQDGAGTDIYYYDLGAGGAPVYAGHLAQSPIYNASIMGDSYYYIQNMSTTLRVAPINADGTMGASSVACELTNAPGRIQFGDIAVSPDGIVYGSGKVFGITQFFVVDLGDCSNTFIDKSLDYNFMLQVALGPDGTLYGQQALSAAGDSPGTWWIVDPANGDLLLQLADLDVSFTDISAGMTLPGEMREETAWGAGTGFGAGNWAMYFSYAP